MLYIQKQKHILAFAMIIAASMGNPVSPFLVSPALAADIQFGGVLPGGAVIQKNVVSMRELKFVDMVPQRTDFSCGAAALATILNYAYNKNLTEDNVIEGLMKVSDPEIVRQKGF